MRKRTWILLTVVLLLTAIFIPTSYAAETASTAAAQTVKTLEITGMGRISYAFDTAEITLGVSEIADSPTAAFQAMSEKINAVVATAQKKGIQEKGLRTGNLSLYQEYDWKDGVQSMRGYRATNTVTIKVTDLSQVPVIMEAAVNAGANMVQGVEFTLSDPEGLQGRAIDAAIDDAKAKAERVAKQLGTKVLGVQKVQVMGNSGPIVSFGMGVKSEAPMAAPAVYGGQGDYTVSVMIVFELQ